MDPVALRRSVSQALAALPAPVPALLRVLVHERTAQGYQALTCGEPEEAGGPGEWSLTPSHTAWRAILARRLPVVVAVEAGATLDLDAAGQVVGEREDGGPSSMTRTLLQARGATHVLATPLPPEGTLVGMCSVELRWPSAGDPSAAVWPALLAALVVAGPATPPRGPARLTGDSHLPVVGPSTEGMLDMLRRFAALDELVLLRGPTGVGKTRLAEWCHERSPRASGPFVTVAGGAGPAELFEAQLFGWKKGAYTGATEAGEGLVQAARGGTLFLDELDKLDLPLQKKLLQFLESHEFRKVGDTRLQHADVRIIVASNADLETMVADGRFLEDLYWRVTVLPVAIPGLDERPEEIPLWAEIFATEAGAALDDPAREGLARRAWPGNLRQLDRFVRRAAALAERGADGRPRVDPRALERAGRAERRAADALVRKVEELARAVAERIVAGEGGHSPLSLEELSWLHGLVLEEAAKRMPLADLYRALGEHRLVDSRNHQAAFKRDVARARGALTKLRG